MGDMRIAVIIAFYLFLAARWDLVRRPIFYLIGAGAVVFALVGGFFNLGISTRKVAFVFDILGSITAFATGVIACIGMELPTAPVAQVAPPPAEAPAEKPEE